MFPQSGIIYIYQPRKLSDNLLESNVSKTPSTKSPQENTQENVQKKLTQPLPNQYTTTQTQQNTSQYKQRSHRSIIQSLIQKQPIQKQKMIGVLMIAISIVGITFPLIPKARLETSYATQQVKKQFSQLTQPTVELPPSTPVVFTPLIGPDGQEIKPVNMDFSIVIPKIGVNATVVPSVDPLNPKEYNEALKHGVAHAKTSYFPNQDGTTYLFSHSTNYQWFVKDLNAIFYNVKNLSEGDDIVIFYKGKRYTYRYTSKQIVNPKDITYLLPVTGKRQLILQTCWPPGTYYKRLLIFADLVEEQGYEI